MNAKQIGENIKAVRKGAGENQITFASAIGITQSTLSSYESGNTLPSLEVLYAIAEKYETSADYLLGLPQKPDTLKSISDIGDFLFELNRKKEVRFDLDIHSHLANDRETPDDRWYAAMYFYGSDRQYKSNPDVCQMLESFEGARSGYECYFTDYETFEDWKKTNRDKYGNRPLTDKESENLSYEERIKKRDQYMEEYLKRNKDKKE